MTEDARPAEDLLEAAADLIKQAAAQLDLRSEACRACHRMRHLNMTHKRVHEQVAALPDRIRRAARALRGEERTAEGRRVKP